jgi:hypothetical protein
MMIALLALPSRFALLLSCPYCFNLNGMAVCTTVSMDDALTLNLNALVAVNTRLRLSVNSVNISPFCSFVPTSR